MHILRLLNWRTPYTGLHLVNRGARIVSEEYGPGFYRMEGVMGFDRWHSPFPLPLAKLQIKEGRRWRTWMVDDPLQWLGMKELARRARPGAVLVAGLGLGVVVYHLQQRRDIERIWVMEKNADVLKLVRPLVFPEPRLVFVLEDYYRHLMGERPFRVQTVIVDLWVGKGKECQPEYDWARTLTEAVYPYPKVLSLYWGFQKGVDISRRAWESAMAAYKGGLEGIATIFFDSQHGRQGLEEANNG